MSKHHYHSKSSGFQITFCGALTLIFITLRLIDKIDWPWYWIISPLWLPTAVVLFGLLAAAAFEVCYGTKKKTDVFFEERDKNAYRYESKFQKKLRERMELEKNVKQNQN